MLIDENYGVNGVNGSGIVRIQYDTDNWSNSSGVHIARSYEDYTDMFAAFAAVAEYAQRYRAPTKAEVLAFLGSFRASQEEAVAKTASQRGMLEAKIADLEKQLKEAKAEHDDLPA